MKGRKRKPTQLHVLEGNPSKLNKAELSAEIKPDSTMPRAPWWLDYHGRKEWDQVCIELHRLGLLTKIDKTALAGYCAAYSRWVKAERELMKGFTYEFLDKDFKMKRTNKPEVIIARDALDQVRRFCIEFGMTPSSRARMVLPGDKGKQDPLDKFLNTGKRDN